MLDTRKVVGEFITRLRGGSVGCPGYREWVIERLEHVILSYQVTDEGACLKCGNIIAGSNRDQQARYVSHRWMAISPDGRD